MTLLSEAVALLGRLKWGGGTERQPPTSGITPFPPPVGPVSSTPCSEATVATASGESQVDANPQ